MTHRVETLDTCTKKLIFNFGTAELIPRIDQALERKRRETNLKGFRKGKAPMALIQKFYGPQVESGAVQDFAMEKASEALREEKLRVIGRPSIDKLDYSPEGELFFELMVEVIPELELQELSSLSFVRKKAIVTEEEVDDFIAKNYLEAVAESKELNDSEVRVEKGHLAVINFEGALPDGSRPEKMRAQEFVLEVGQGRLIPGFEEGVVGMARGEKKELKLAFPEDYHAQDLQGSEVTFTVELLEVKEKTYPPLNDELAKKFECENVEELKDKSRKNLMDGRQGEVNRHLEMEVISKIIEQNPFDVPGSLLKKEQENIREMLKEGNPLEEEKVEQMATSRVRETILFLFLANKYDVVVGDSEVDSSYESMVGASGEIPEERASMIKNNIRETIFRKKIFDKIFSEIQLVDE